MTPATLPPTWRARADELERFAPAAAEAFRAAADELEEAIRTAGDATLTLAEASMESGLAERTLRQHVAEGKLPNAGRKGAPRIRRADLPKRARSNGAGWDPSAHVAEITGTGR